MKKTLTVLLALVLVIAMSVAGTMAYLTSTDTVTNTFTVGNVKITMDEKDTDHDNNTADNVAQPDGSVRDKANSYKLIPGHPYTKDPTIHVDANSEECWLFVQVTNEIAAIEDQTNTVASQMTAKGWSLVTGETNVYAYRDKVSAGSSVVVFDGFTIAGDVNNTTLATYSGKTIVVKAYAVQAEGFATSAAAWEKAPCSFT